MDFELFLEAFPKLVSGIDDTLLLALSSLVIGFVFAVFVALMRMSDSRILSNFAIGYVYIFRSTPLLVQIFLIYYGLGQFKEFWESVGLWFLFENSWVCAILALTLNTTAYGSEIIRGGIQSVPWGQIEAARAIGHSGLKLFRRIIFPIAMRQALPAYSNEFMLMIKATSLASTITIVEITAIAKQIIGATFQTIEVIAIAGAFYLFFNSIAGRLFRFAEHRLNPLMKSA